MAAPCGASGSVMGSLSPPTSAITPVSDLGKNRPSQRFPISQKLQDLAATASQINGTEPAKLTREEIKRGLSQAQQIDDAVLSENPGMYDIDFFGNKFLRHMLSSIPIQIVASGAASGAEIGRATVRLPISDFVGCSRCQRLLDTGAASGSRCDRCKSGIDVGCGNSLTTLAEQHCIRPSRDAMIGEWRAMISAHLKDIFPEACEYEMSAFGSSVLGQGLVMLDEFDGDGFRQGRRCVGAPKPGEFLLLMANAAIRLPSGIENDPRTVRRQLPESPAGRQLPVVVDIVIRIGAAESPSLGVVFKEFHGREIFGFGVLEILDGTTTARFKGSEVLVWARRGNQFAELQQRSAHGPMVDRRGSGVGYAPRQSPAEEPVFLFVFDSKWFSFSEWNLADAIGQDILTRMAGMGVDWKAEFFQRFPEYEDIFGILTTPTRSTGGHGSFLVWYLDRSDPSAAKEIYEDDILGDVWEEITSGDHVVGEDDVYGEGSSSVKQTASERDGINVCGSSSDGKPHGTGQEAQSSDEKLPLAVTLCVARASDPVEGRSLRRWRGRY